MKPHFDFYADVLKELLHNGQLTLDSSILVVCGGPSDKDTLQSVGFRSVTVSNVDERLLGSPDGQFAPYLWMYENAEGLTPRDDSFDICIVHSGLHHCHSPHKAISEMYRVARNGILMFEPHESWFTKLGARLGVGQTYETWAVWGNGLRWGGVANTAIPNFVYRFSAGEIRKVIAAMQPEYLPCIRFWYRTRANLDFPNAAAPVRLLARLVRPALLLLGKIAPFCANNFAAFVTKPGSGTPLQPWLRKEAGRIFPDDDYFRKIYGPVKPD